MQTTRTRKQAGGASKLTIGKLARAAGMSVSTVRYYQQRGLLAQPNKSSMGGYRYYSQEDVTRLGLIKRAQGLQFTLAEILRLVDCLDRNDCDAVRDMAESKLRSIRLQLRVLEQSRKDLSNLLVRCSGGDAEACPLFRALVDGEPPCQLPGE